MENNIQILENIMKPYFDKKDEVENNVILKENEKIDSNSKIKDLKNERISKRKELEVELENLRVRRNIAIKDFQEKKEQEIKEYIKDAFDPNSSFFTNYGSVLRKDLEQRLEQEYDRKLQMINENFKIQEEQLISDIKSLRSVSEEEKNEKENLEGLNKKLDYRRVDLRELVEIKRETRKQLIQEQKRLNLELQQQQINFDSKMLELSAFKYEYNDQQQVINGAEWRKIYEQSNEISDKIREIRSALKKIEEYLSLAEPTKEEYDAIMMSMTPWEKEEYDRRKNIAIEDNDEKEDEIDPDDIVEINDPVTSEFEDKKGNIIVDDKANLLKTIYNDIIDQVKSLKSVKLNPSKGKLEESQRYISTKENEDDYQLNGVVNLPDDELVLPNGEYVNTNDINQALDALYSKNKAKTYKVTETKKKYQITDETIKKFKSKLKKLSTIRLIKDKKISKLDLLRVFGKGRSEEIEKEVEIGEIKETNLPEGDYVSRNELILALDNLFASKKISWLKSLSENLRNKISEKLEKKKEEIEIPDLFLLDSDFEESNVNLDDEFHIKSKK